MMPRPMTIDEKRRVGGYQYASSRTKLCENPRQKQMPIAHFDIAAPTGIEMMSSSLTLRRVSAPSSSGI